ncbi:hypothetical protein ABMA46_08230 [Mesorhizobium sp. CN5-321]|uniref:hypothetical protein n=1 Tax=Mesorhizobium hunchu TaxID=3157708 RepID=UPI0032B7E766
METTPGFSQPAGHEKAAQKPGEPLVSAPATLVDVSLTSKPIKSVPASEKTLDTTHNGFPYAKSLTVDDIAYIKTGSALRDRYCAEANSHRNMKQRADQQGKVVSPAISDFSDFLLLIGPMPQPGMTLDRIDNNDPEYAPGKVRWATKKVQNNNKSDTRVYTLSNGMKFTASQLAEHFGLTADAIRKRSDRGWTDEEVILGRRVKIIEPAKKQKSSGYIPEPSNKFPAGLYDREQLAQLNRGETRLSDIRAIQFHRQAHDQQGYREQFGEEFIMMTYEEMQEHPELAVITPEQQERHFLRRWPVYRPHTVYENLTPAQRGFVARVDPEWATKMRAKLDAKTAMADLL